MYVGSGIMKIYKFTKYEGKERLTIKTNKLPESGFLFDEGYKKIKEQVWSEVTTAGNYDL